MEEIRKCANAYIKERLKGKQKRNKVNFKINIIIDNYEQEKC